MLNSKTGPWFMRAARQAVLIAGDLLGLNALCRRRRARCVRVLNYHGVLARALPGSLWTQLDAAKFRRQMRYLKNHYRVLPASQVDWANRAESTANRVVVTFDDGLANNLDVAAPILEELGLRATCFVAPGLIETEPGAMIWADRLYDVFLNPDTRGIDLTAHGMGRIDLPNDAAGRVAALDRTLQALKKRTDAARRDAVEAIVRAHPPCTPPDHSPLRLLTRSELARIAAGPAFEIGLHSNTHPIMSRLTPEEQRSEIDKAVAALESWGVPFVRVFAYPNGKPEDFDGHTIEALRRRRFDVAMTTTNGQWDPATGDPMRIERLMIGDDVTWWEFKAMLSGYLYCLKNLPRRRAGRTNGK